LGNTVVLSPGIDYLQNCGKDLSKKVLLTKQPLEKNHRQEKELAINYGARKLKWI
jgi:hypothetical protein